MALRVCRINIAAIAGNVLTVTGYDGVTPVQRLQQGAIDVKIEKGTAGTIEVSDATGLVAGAAPRATLRERLGVLEPCRGGDALGLAVGSSGLRL